MQSRVSPVFIFAWTSLFLLAHFKSMQPCLKVCTIYLWSEANVILKGKFVSANTIQFFRTLISLKHLLFRKFYLHINKMPIKYTYKCDSSVSPWYKKYLIFYITPYVSILGIHLKNRKSSNWILKTHLKLSLYDSIRLPDCVGMSIEA